MREWRKNGKKRKEEREEGEKRNKEKEREGKGNEKEKELDFIPKYFAGFWSNIRVELLSSKTKVVTLKINKTQFCRFIQMVSFAQKFWGKTEENEKWITDFGLSQLLTTGFLFFKSQPKIFHQNHLAYCNSNCFYFLKKRKIIRRIKE